MKKYKIYLPDHIHYILQSDIQQFKFIKNESSYNKNKFYNTVIMNLTRLFKDKKINSINTFDLFEEVDNKYSKNSNYITIRSTKETESLFLSIEKNELNNNTISNYLRNLFEQYISLPIYKRELVLYYDNYLIIMDAIKSKRKLYIETKYSNYEFDAITIKKSKEENHNFLIGKAYFNNLHTVSSIKLSNILKIITLNKKTFFTIEEINSIENCIKRGPEFITDNLVSAKIQFTNGGIKMFDKCYKDRPTPLSIDKENNIYYFNNSIEHLFFYLKQFGRHAIVLEPIELNKKLADFYDKALNAYISYKK